MFLTKSPVAAALLPTLLVAAFLKVGDTWRRRLLRPGPRRRLPRPAPRRAVAPRTLRPPLHAHVQRLAALLPGV
jgi:hypothetical protein